MPVPYDQYYRTENLFGEPYPELIRFFTGLPKHGKLLDLGCGQGRDALALAKMGYEVTGIDHSEVGIRQMVQKAEAEGLKINGIVGDIYSTTEFDLYDFILLDSMLHFSKPDVQKETDLVKKIINGSKKEALIIFCIQHSGKKVAVLQHILSQLIFDQPLKEADFIYTYCDQESGHSSSTPYKLLAIKK